MRTLLPDQPPAELREALDAGEYSSVERSRIVDLGAAQLERAIEWSPDEPPSDDPPAAI